MVCVDICGIRTVCFHVGVLGTLFFKETKDACVDTKRNIVSCAFDFQQLVQGFLLTVFQHSKILFGLTAVLLAEVVWIAFDRAYAVFRIKWSQWMHRAGADGSSRL